MNSIVKQIEKMSWAELTATQQLIILRKQQLRIREPNVYAIRIKDEKEFKYLIYINGVEEIWGPLTDSDVAIYPSYDVADYVRGQHQGSTVITIPKNEFRTLPVFGKLLREGMVSGEGNWNV